MAYEGYLIKIGNYKLPHKYISAESYSVYKNTQDLDSYRDADGKLHRTALEHTPNKVEFDTRNMLTDVEFSILMSNIRNNYSNLTERKASVTLYIPESDSYVTQDMYMADIQPQIYLADSEKIQYKPIRFAFIGY